MEYVGHATINGTEYESARISQPQGASQTFALMFDATQTQEQLPSVSTAAVTGITPTSAIVGGNVTDEGGSTVIDRGICWNTTGTPTLNDNCLHIGSGTGAFSDNLTGLTEGSTYYVRAYAINSEGIGYGNIVTFSTTTPSDQPFTIITAEVIDTNISSSSAICGGEVFSNGGISVTSRGVCWDTLHFPLVYGNHIANGNGTGSFTCNITDLQYGTTYYVRAYATDSVGTAYYGNEVSFTTDPVLPTVFTTAISNITTTTATGGGNVTDDGGAPVTARGVCWSSTSQNPTIADSHTTDGGGTGNFISSITGLTPNYTLYYVRAYATNSAGTAYGYPTRFITNPASQDGPPCPGTATLTDIDGNTYNTVQIGNQCWMKENLRTKKYANGTPISQGGDTSTTTAYWYYPNNNPSNQSAYGLLYNWKAMMHNSTSSGANPSGVQGICPNGWHVPSDAEWTQLTDFVSSQSEYVCGGDDTYIAKALSGTTGWASETMSCGPCSVCTMPSSTNNATGFSALPAGYYAANSSYYGFSWAAIFWSSTSEDTRRFYRYIFYRNSNVLQYAPNDIWNENLSGFSVRCLKD